MSTTGQRAVRDALRTRHAELEQTFFLQARVVAVASTSVTVLAADGARLVVPFLGSYPPAVDDVVWLAGPPGAWVALGALAPRGVPAGGDSPATPVAHAHAESDVTGLAADLASKVPGDDPRLSNSRAWSLYDSSSGAPSAGQVPTWNGTRFTPATPAAGSGTAAPAVCVARLRSSSGNPPATTNTTQTTATKVAELPVAVTVGRLYEIKVQAAMNGPANATGLTQINYTTDGSVPTAASTRLRYQAVDCSPTGGLPVEAGFTTYFTPTANQTLKLAVSFCSVSGGAVSLTVEAQRPLEVVVTDLGVDPGASGSRS